MSFLSEYLELRRKQRDDEREQFEFEAQSPEEVLESVNSNTEFTADLVGTRNKDARKQHKAILDSLGSIGESLVASEFSEELIVDGIDAASSKEQASSKIRNESLAEIAKALKELVGLNKKLEKYLRPELNPKDDTYAKRNRKAAFEAFPKIEKKEEKKDTSVSDWLSDLFDFGNDKKRFPKSGGKRGGRTYRPTSGRGPGRAPSYKTPKLPKTPPAGRYGRFMASAKTALGSIWNKGSTPPVQTTVGKSVPKVGKIQYQPAIKTDLPKVDVPKVSMTDRIKDAWKAVSTKTTDIFKSVSNTVTNNNSKLVVEKAAPVKAAGSIAPKPTFTESVSKAATSAKDSVKSWFTPETTKAATKAAAPTAVGRIGTVLGKVATPLAIATSGYEAYQTEQREDLTRDEKNVKHGGTAGGLAGAIAGAKLGGVVGGTAGAAFMGVGAVPGALLGAVTGGIAGYFGGSALGEKAVEVYQEATSKVTDLPDDIKQHVGETAVELQEASNEQATTNLDKAQAAIASTNTDATTASVEAITAASTTLATATTGAANTLSAGSTESASMLSNATKAASVAVTGALSGLSDKLSATWDTVKEAFSSNSANLLDRSAQLINRFSVSAGGAMQKAGDKLKTSADGTIFSGTANFAGRALGAIGRGVESGGTSLASTAAKAAQEVRPMRVSGPSVVPEGRGSVNATTQKNWEKYGGDIVSAADRYGIDPAAMTKIMRVESGNFDASVDTQRRNWLAGKDGASSAMGLGQFVDATWAEQLRRHGAENAETSKHVEAARNWIADKRGTKEKHMDPAYREMLEAKLDPKANALMSAAFTKGNMKLLDKAGVSNASEAELYSVHMTGNAKAAKAYRDNPNAPIDQVFTPDEIKNNPGYFKNAKTVSDVINSMQSKLDAGKAYGDAATQMAKNMKDPTGTTALAGKTPDTKVSVAKSGESQPDTAKPANTEVKIAAARVDKATASTPSTAKAKSEAKPVTAVAAAQQGEQPVTERSELPAQKVTPKIAAAESRPYTQVLPKTDKTAYDSLSFTKPVEQSSFADSFKEAPRPDAATVLSSKQSPIPKLAASIPPEVSPVEVTNPQLHQGNQSTAAAPSVGNAFDTAVPKLDNVPLQVTDLGLILLNVGHI